jgi:hypothetical protein
LIQIMVRIMQLDVPLPPTAANDDDDNDDDADDGNEREKENRVGSST